jgi:SAM-dependent methyltransferase
VKELTTRESWDSGWQRWVPRRGLGLSMRLFNREFDRLHRAVLAQVPQGARWLEIGGAPGAMIARYHRMRPDVRFDCLDYSEDGIQRTRETYAAEGIEGEVILADFRAGGERFGSYDVVTSYGFIEHFDNFAEAIAVHYRYARPGGTVLIAVPDLTPAPMRWLLPVCAQGMLSRHNLAAMARTALERAATDAGADIIRSATLGGALFHHSEFDPNWRGRAYKLGASVWNLAIAAFAAATGYALVPRLWDGYRYVWGQRRAS